MSPTSSSGSESAPRRKDVSGVPVRESGLVGTLFEPVSAPMGGVLVLGGSDGSIPKYTANQLAQAGFSALALAWFGHPGLPAEAIEVPLEYFHRALRFLQARAPLRGAKVGIWGNSKGAEAALLVAASYRDVAAVVGVAASGVAWHGLGSGFKDRTWMRRSTWTRAGDPVPFVPGVVDHRPAVVHGALVLTPMHLAAMQDAEALQRAAIAVERIKGPVLLISGEEDQLWPSQELCELAMKRLRASAHPYPDQHLSFAGAGHGITTSAREPVLRSEPLATAGGLALALGGELAATRKASHESWQRTLQFFTAHLG